MPAKVRRLTLNNFRNYRAAILEAGSRPVVLYGPNGAGKTNLIEAISFLAPGRGLRRATVEEGAFIEGDGSWAGAAASAGAVGGAGDGCCVRRRPIRAPALARPLDAHGRFRARQPCQRAGTLAALAQ